VLLALVVGLRIVDRRLGLIDLLEARAIGLDQVADLVARDAKLRLGIGQSNPIRLGIEVEERVVLFDRDVRFDCDANDLTRNLRADRNYCSAVRKRTVKRSSPVLGIFYG
jgi:hypothetical protein